jgi:hypothetical protein
MDRQTEPTALPETRGPRRLAVQLGESLLQPDPLEQQAQTLSERRDRRAIAHDRAPDNVADLLIEAATGLLCPVLKPADDVVVQIRNCRLAHQHALRKSTKRPVAAGQTAMISSEGLLARPFSLNVGNVPDNDVARKLTRKLELFMCSLPELGILAPAVTALSQWEIIADLMKGVPRVFRDAKLPTSVSFLTKDARSGVLYLIQMNKLVAGISTRFSEGKLHCSQRVVVTALQEPLGNPLKTFHLCLPLARFLFFRIEDDRSINI